MTYFKLSAVLIAAALAGCAAPAPEPQPQPMPKAPIAAPVPPNPFEVFGGKMGAEIDAADGVRQRAVEAMAELPAKQRINKSETRTRMQQFESASGQVQSVKVLDAVAIDLPLAAKARDEHKNAMVAIKDIATLLADERGSATIQVMVSPTDLRAKRVNLKAGTADTEAGHPVEVKKAADKAVPAGIERFIIQGAALPRKLD
ncbi:hypothetical protein GCM10027082_40560 [Comamonas humi]